MRRIIHDREAIQNLVLFGCAHRAAVATRSLDWFTAAKSEADRLSASVEAFENFMAAIEQLEMVLLSLRTMTRGPATKSFLFTYAATQVREGCDRHTGAWHSNSAGALLQVLHRSSWHSFQQTFGLPSYSQIASRTSPLSPALTTERGYQTYLRGLRRGIREALRHRRTLRLQRAYNKVKHGAVMLRATGTDRIVMLHALRPRTTSSCHVVGIPYSARLSTVQTFANMTQQVAKLTAELLCLRFDAFS